MNIKRLIQNRRSYRTFNGEILPEDVREKLMNETQTIHNPFGVPVRFVFLDHAGKDSAYRLGTRGVVTGTETYVAGTVSRQAPHAMEGFGYEFERFCLRALEMNVGTAILAASVERDAFQQAIGLQADEMMPTITPVGYAAERDSIQEMMMRRGMRSDTRKEFEDVFFENGFHRPLSRAGAGRYADALEMLRLAPSSGNGQPWSVVKVENGFHFFRVQKPGMPKTPASEIKKMDVGIAMCHFDLTRLEDGIDGEWADSESQLDFAIPHGTDYIYSFLAKE